MTYESELEKKLRERLEGKIGKLLKPKSNKLEKRKYETVKKIVENLPSTLQVLHKRTGLTKTTLKRYLEKLMSDYVRAVRRELDMYFLEDDISLNPHAPHPVAQVWYRWQDLPEYKTPKVSVKEEKGLALKLSLRGRESEASKALRKTTRKSVKRNKEK